MEIFDAEGRTVEVLLEDGTRLLRYTSRPVEDCAPIRYGDRVFRGNNLNQDEDECCEPVPLSSVTNSRKGAHPSVILPDGSKVFMSYGRIESPLVNGEHLPAIIRPNGDWEWYHKGRMHCFTEDGQLLPSIVRADGTSEWRNSNGLLHSRYGAKIVPAIGDKYYLNGVETPLEDIARYC